MAWADKSKGLSLSGGRLTRSAALSGSRPCARDPSLNPEPETEPCAAGYCALLCGIAPNLLTSAAASVSVFASSEP
jgi:hypothetical protein